MRAWTLYWQEKKNATDLSLTSVLLSVQPQLFQVGSLTSTNFSTLSY